VKKYFRLYIIFESGFLMFFHSKSIIILLTAKNSLKNCLKIKKKKKNSRYLFI